MSKIRVHELAKELNISSKVIIEKLKENGVDVTSHMSTLEASSVNKIKGIYEKKAPVAEKTVPVAEKVMPVAEKASTVVEKKPEGVAKKPEQLKPTQNPYNQQQKPSNTQQTGNRPSGQKPQQYNKPQQGNTNRPQGTNTGGAQGQNANRPQSTNTNRPQGQNANRPQGTNTNRPQGQNANRPQGTNTNRPQGQNANRPQGANTSQNTGYKNNNTSGSNRTGGYNSGGYNNNYRGNNNNRPGGRSNYAKKPAVVKPVVPEEKVELIQIPPTITIKELAALMRKKGSEVVKMLFKKGQLLNINNTIDFDTATEIAAEYEILVELEEEKDIFEEAFKDDVEDEKNLIKRPPVVVVMGHVDHGKTSLLDAIRKSKVTTGEAGGITQHIGAYTVDINGNPITFLDTPGHEAFTAMRMRGAQVTDIAVLVVAADDGVMPQTVEAINHARAAGVEIIVAINKIDKAGANPDRVKQELTEHNILTEDWGGETICVPVSALNNTGIDNLLEMIILASEIKELRANPKRIARGTVIEAQLDKGRGPVATVLVQNGTLSIGDPIVAGSTFGKIRAMMDDKGRRVKKAGPSIPVEILGLSEVPSAGDSFYAAESEKYARSVAETVVAKTRTEMIKHTPNKVSLDDLFTQIQSGNVKDLNIVVKADVQGSVEAVKQSLEKLSNEEVRVRIIHGGVGTITESDVMLASASNALIIGFNVRSEPMAKSFAETEEVDIRLYKVIYNAIEDVNNALKGLLDPVYEEKIIGHAVVRQLFKASGVGVIAGSYVTDGKFQRGCMVRIFRNEEKIHEGDLDSLKRFKDDVKEVNTNYECGLVIKKFNDLKEDDVVEAYIMVEVPR